MTNQDQTVKTGNKMDSESLFIFIIVKKVICKNQNFPRCNCGSVNRGPNTVNARQIRVLDSWEPGGSH